MRIWSRLWKHSQKNLHVHMHRNKHTNYVLLHIKNVSKLSFPFSWLTQGLHECQGTAGGIQPLFHVKKSDQQRRQWCSHNTAELRERERESKPTSWVLDPTVLKICFVLQFPAVWANKFAFVHLGLFCHWKSKSIQY